MVSSSLEAKFKFYNLQMTLLPQKQRGLPEFHKLIIGVRTPAPSLSYLRLFPPKPQWVLVALLVRCPLAKETHTAIFLLAWPLHVLFNKWKHILFYSFCDAHCFPPCSHPEFIETMAEGGGTWPPSRARGTSRHLSHRSTWIILYGAPHPSCPGGCLPAFLGSTH